MIRRTALLCLLALPISGPAQAQDFRGLMPGMSASEIARLGEPEWIEPSADGRLTVAQYPLPFSHRLQVHQDGERILALMSYGLTLRSPAERDAIVGLESYSSTMADALALAGSEGGYFTERGLYEVSSIEGEPDTRVWRLAYTLADTPDVVLELQFYVYDMPEDVETDADGLVILPENARFVRATLYHADYLANFADGFDANITPRPGSMPFAPPLADVFPILEIPQ